MTWLRHSFAALSAALLAPIGALALLVRPSWRTGWRERLGGGPVPEPGAVWVHGASLGEAHAALSLLAALEGAGCSTYASATTVVGLAALRDGWSGPSSLAPLDHPWCVEAALARVEPSLLALVETELWPCWVAAAARRGIPVAVVSGRISDRSLPRYRALRSAFAPTLRRLTAVGARSREDAERFTQLGVPPQRVRVTGDLKLAADGEIAPLASDLAAALPEGTVVVAGSTHEGEEEAVLDALEYCEARGRAFVLVVAPRHLARADAVHATLSRSGRRVVRRSAGLHARLEAGEVLLLDTLGELASLYERADVAFVGGTLAPVGGHNLLEPLRAGCCVVFGPRVENVREAAALAEATRAGTSVADAGALGPALDTLLADASRRKRGDAARKEIAALGDTAVRNAEMVCELLAATAGAT